MTAASLPRPAPAAGGSAGDASPVEFTYDAFISYSGFRKGGVAADFDRKVAERLHRSLEAYRVPRGLTKKSSARAPLPRRLKKIFRDRDEMRAGGSLDQSLTDALRRSRFLIVVCSPRARESQWVNQEIATFRGLGRAERILPLLIEGEPAEAFPEELFRARADRTPAGAGGEWLAQPLAADIRAPSVSKSLRLLKEEKLRLLAAILGCEYDDLRQREQERFVRRVTVAGAAMLAGLLVLTTLSLLLYFEQQRARRNSQLAVSAASSILHLTVLDPNSPSGANSPLAREFYTQAAINNLETIRQDDPENLKCLTTLRALHGARSKLFKTLNKPEEAQEHSQKARSLMIPIALSRLRAWRPAETPQGAEGEQSVWKDYDRKGLRQTLDIMQPMEDMADFKHAVEYTDIAAEYVPLLDTSTAEGEAEARRVLQSSLKRFQNARALETPTQPQADLAEAVESALDRLPPGE